MLRGKLFQSLGAAPALAPQSFQLDHLYLQEELISWSEAQSRCCLALPKYNSCPLYIHMFTYMFVCVCERETLNSKISFHLRNIEYFFLCLQAFKDMLYAAQDQAPSIEGNRGIL